MTFGQYRQNNLVSGKAIICGGKVGDRNAWMLPGGRVTLSREEAERALRFVVRAYVNRGERVEGQE